MGKSLMEMNPVRTSDGTQETSRSSSVVISYPVTPVMLLGNSFSLLSFQ